MALPPHAFYRIHIDFLGPVYGMTYLLLVDAYSKWVEVYRMSSVSTSAVILKLQDFMSRYGTPHTLVSDNGTAFISKEFHTFCETNGIKHMTSPAYHPSSNGQAESFVKIIKKGIKSSILFKGNNKDCQSYLLKYLFDYRNSVHSTTGSSPAQLVFGRKLRCRLDLVTQSTPSSPSEPLADHVRNKQCSQSKHYGGTNKESYVPGDYVLYKQPYTNKQQSWGKGQVIKRLGKVTYIVKDIVTAHKHKKHKNQLILMDKGTNSDQPTQHSQFDKDDWLQQHAAAHSNKMPATEAATLEDDLPSRVAPCAQMETSAVSANSSLRQEEFYDALESDTLESEPELLDRGAGGKLLRPLSKVDYKQYF